MSGVVKIQKENVLTHVLLRYCITLKIKTHFVCSEIFTTCLGESWAHHTPLSLTIFYPKNNKEYTNRAHDSLQFYTTRISDVHVDFCIYQTIRVRGYGV